jgi:hypothetical protein
LQTWQEKRNLSDAVVLSKFISALHSKSNLKTWADFDFFNLLPKPKSRTAIHLVNISRYIALIRNVLIFLPVAITWYAIGSATRAFENYLKTGGESTANFLEFWQKGGGGLGDMWRIGNVATLDFLIILTLILLSFTSGLFQTIALKISGRENKIFENERTLLAVEIYLVLAQEIPTTVKNLRRLQSDIGKLVKVSEQISDKSRNTLFLLKEDWFQKKHERFT